MVTHTCNPISQEVEAGGWWTLGQPWVHSEIVSQKSLASNSHKVNRYHTMNSKVKYSFFELWIILNYITLFFIICSHCQTRSCSKTVIIKAMSQTPYLHKFPNSQRHEKNHFTVFFACWSCRAHTSMTGSPLPWDFPLPFLTFTASEAATVTACDLRSSQETNTPTGSANCTLFYGLHGISKRHSSFVSD